MPDESPAPVFTPKDYKETFKVAFCRCCFWKYSHDFQKRTVTSEFAECDTFFSHFLCCPSLIPVQSPCVEASKASMDCLNRHDYDRDKCLDFFQAYRDCKKTWVGLIITFPPSRIAPITHAN
jgi:hypothetical protein